VMGGVKIRF